MSERSGMQLLLVVIVVMAAFFITLRIVLSRVSNRRSVPMVVGIVAFLYVCFGIVLYVMLDTVGSAGYVLVALLGLAAIMALAWMINFLVKNSRDINKGALALLITYIAAVLFITILSRFDVTNTKIRMELFPGIRAMLTTGNPMRIKHSMLNIALFVPIGLLLPIVHRKFSSVFFAAMGGAMFSTLIETVQMFAAIGECDLNDILMNTIGSAVGFLLCRLFYRRPRE